MGAPQLTEQVRKRLVALMAEDRPDEDRFLTRLREFRTLEGVPACSAVVRMLSHLEFRESEAEQLLTDVLGHRRELGGRLRRDPGLRVAALDYLSNVRPMLRNPAMVEQSELRRSERSAILDDLTELHNRRYARRQLELEVERSRRTRQALALLALDLDAFKSVNDLYGHPFGNLVLQQVGRVLRRAVRAPDLAARIGGEEFAVILPETDRLGAHVAGERIRLAIERHFDEQPIGDRAIAMTVSGGVAAYPRDGDDAAGLLARADQALYQSKIHGGNRITVYHSERRQDLRFPAGPRGVVALSEPGGPAAGTCRLLNLSRGGALVAADLATPRGERVRVSLRDAGDPPSRPGWSGSARVVRVEDVAGAERRLALAFDEPISDARLARQVSLSAPRRPARETP